MTTISPAVEQMLSDVQIDFPWNLVQRFAKMQRCLPADVNASCDELVNRLREQAVPVEVLMTRLYLSIPIRAQVRLGDKILQAKPSSFSISTPAGLRGELVYVPANYSASISTLFHRNTQASDPQHIRGRIVVSEGYATPAKMRDFELAGAIGVIAINPGVDVHWGICTTIWGSPELDDLPRKPAIPIVAVNHPDGQRLIAAAASDQTVTIETELEEGWFDQKLPVVTIPGNSQDFVLLHGHYDSWDVGVGDNATGDGALMEIARVLWKHRGHLERSIRIAWWPGHSTGRYAGSTWFADHFAADLDEHCVAQINCDSPGCRWATEYRHVSWMAETEAFAKRTIASVTGLMAQGERPHRAGDYAFNNIGVSGLMMLSSTMPQELAQEKGYYAVGGCGGNIAWHTENDTLAIADPHILMRDIRVYLGLVACMATEPILPLDWRALMREFKETINRYQQALGSDYSLARSMREVDVLEDRLNLVYQHIEAGQCNADTANGMIRRLARALVPINHTLMPRFAHDAASAMPALPTLAIALRWPQCAAEHRDFALTQIKRGENKFLGALRQALHEVQSALAT